MRIFITGAGGFVGRHVVRDLYSNGHEVLAFDTAFASPVEGMTESFTGDLKDSDSVEAAVQASKPEACVHLGAVSFVPAGELDPEAMFTVNVLGTVNLLEAFRKHAPSARLLLISTSHVYGPSSNDKPITESAPLQPTNMYAISKAAAETSSLLYVEKYGMCAMTARPTNHTGPGQIARFVVPSFARQVMDIARGRAEPIIRTGNLDSVRSFVDVRDVCRAYRLLIEKGKAGDAYNIASPERVRIGDILSALCRMANITPRIELDMRKYRPTDVAPLLDTTRIRKTTGWETRIPFDQTMRDILAES